MSRSSYHPVSLPSLCQCNSFIKIYIIESLA